MCIPLLVKKLFIINITFLYLDLSYKKSFISELVGIIWTIKTKKILILKLIITTL